MSNVEVFFYRKMGQKELLYLEKETFGISWTTVKRELVEFETHRAYRRQEGEEQVTYLTCLCK